jgi:hypothetical protein
VRKWRAAWRRVGGSTAALRRITVLQNAPELL